MRRVGQGAPALVTRTLGAVDSALKAGRLSEEVAAIQDAVATTSSRLRQCCRHDRGLQSPLHPFFLFAIAATHRRRPQMGTAVAGSSNPSPQIVASLVDYACRNIMV
ncbi:hypothetical protein EJB05_03095, partial [Eragrostis curvula]